jgi:hypothetical protein
VAFSQRLPAAIRNIKLEPDWQEFTQVLVGEGICAALSVPSGPGPVLGPGCPGRRCFWPGRWDRSAWRCLPFWYLGWRTGQQAREQAPTTSLSLADACNDNGRRPCRLAHRTEEPDLTDWYGRRAKPFAEPEGLSRRV